jgi:hypothetical protein
MYRLIALQQWPGRDCSLQFDAGARGALPSRNSAHGWNRAAPAAGNGHLNRQLHTSQFMTKSSLNPNQRRTVEIIEALGFGVIERLSIRGGLPCYEQEPHIVQSIKLDSESEAPPDRSYPDLTLKKEFESLFDQLKRLGDAIVDIEIRHSLPSRLVLERRYKELL